MRRSLVAMVLLLAACGSGDPDTAGTAAFCTAYGEHLTLTKDMDEAADAGALRSAAGEQRGALDAVRAGAPAVLVDHVEEVVGLWDRVLQILERYGYDAIRLVNEASSEERAVFLELDAAGGPSDDPTRKVQDWVRANCPDVSVPPAPSFSPVDQGIGY